MAKNNLKNAEATQFKSGKEAAESGRKGGIASGEAKRAKKSMKAIAQAIAEAKVSDKNRAALTALGVNDEGMVNNALVTASIFKAAVNGNMSAVDKWTALVDDGGASEKEYMLPARFLGRAFVDIDRNLKPNYTYIFKGGRGGLKSSYISMKIVELIKNTPNIHACIVRKVASTLKDSVYAQIKWAINELGLEDEFDCKKNPLEIVYKKTGQTLYFRGCDDPIKLKSIKPSFGYIGILWKEEADQLAGPEDERSINQSVLRGGPIAYDFVSYNPPKSKQSWVNQILLEPNDKRIVHESNYLEAPPEWLGQKFLDDAAHLKEVNPEAYEHEYMGVANGDGGAVFEFLQIREITNAEIKYFDHIYQGVDWGWYPDIYAFVRVHYDIAHETIYILDEICGNKMRNADTAEMIIDKGYDDYEIICDSSEKKSVNDYKDAGLRAKPAIKGPGSVEYGMKWMQCRHIVIDPSRTPVAYKEFSRYEYERDKDGNVISGYPDRDNHTIDAVRYALERYTNKRGNQA